MTQAYLRVKRDGHYENIEVEHLTEEELDSIIGSRNKDEIMSWFKMVCKTLHIIEEKFFEPKEEGEDHE